MERLRRATFTDADRKKIRDANRERNRRARENWTEEQREAQRAKSRENMRRRRADPATHERDELSRHYWRASKMGATREQIDAAMKVQDERCAICRAPFNGKRPCLDHDHATGKFRGLLCARCNVGLGSFADNTTSLQAAIHYLVAARGRRQA